MFKRVLSLSLFVTIFIATAVSGQNISDLRNINPSQLTASQLAQINQQLEQSGMSLNQVAQMAELQGLSPQQASTLVNRLRDFRQSSGVGSENQQAGEPVYDLRTMNQFYDESSFTTFDTEQDSIPDSLRIYGMDHFTEVSTTFEPSMNIPSPADYVLAPGDELIIDVWGASVAHEELIINPEGRISVPNLGPVQVSGLTLDDARMVILNRLTSIYSGLNPENQDQGNIYASVSIGNIRQIMVRVSGSVKQPGVYSVSSLADAYNVLYAAGGPDENGTFREISIRRNGSEISTMDLYDFLSSGNMSGNMRLQSNDVIHVGTYRNRIHVTGEAKEVGFFELLEGETFSDLVTYIGGFREDAYTQHFVIRGAGPEMRRIRTIRYPEEADALMNHGDRLRIDRITDRYENRVTIRGPVMRPGDYELKDGMSLYDLFVAADGLLEETHRERGTITRLDENRETFNITFNPGLVMSNPSENDLLLHPDDSIQLLSIYDLQEEYYINVSGPVNRPGQFAYREFMTVEDAVFEAMGFRDDAAPHNIEVARRITGGADIKGDEIAETHYFSVDENLRFEPLDPANEEFYLEPFDRIYVRSQPNYQSQQTVEVIGEVQIPGEYVLNNRRARLSDLVDMARGPSAYANLEGARLMRRVTDLSRRPRQDLLDIQSAQSGGIGVGTEEDSLVTIPREAVTIRLAAAIAAPGGAEDLTLYPDDLLEIPRHQETVEIQGEVLRPTHVQYQPGQRLSSYLDEAGGVTEQARRKRAYVVYANGEVDRTRGFLGIFRNDPRVEPGSTIVIPARPASQQMSPQERIALASSIASTALLFVTLMDRLQN